MGSNGLDLTTNMNCDVEISHGADVFGYLMRSGTKLQERRGNAFAGQVASGAPTYQEAGPYSRTVWETFGGGFGQEQQNRVFGGPAGQGGDAGRYYFSNAWTGKGNLLLPGLVRLLTRKTPTATAYSSDEVEMPRGEIPARHPNGGYNNFNLTTGRTFGAIRVLVWFYTPTATNLTVTATIDGTHQFTSDPINDPYNYHMLKWVTLKKVGGGTVNLSAGRHYIRAPYNQHWGYGCYVGTTLKQDNVTTLNNCTLLYFQFADAAGKSTWDMDDKVVIHETTLGKNVLNEYTYVPNVLTYTTLYNFYQEADIDGIITEYPFGGTYAGSVVFDNKLFLGTTGTGQNKTVYWTHDNAGNSLAPQGTNTNYVLGKGVIHEGQYYFIDGQDRATIKKVDLSNIANNPTTIINAGVIGSPTAEGFNYINNLIIFQGLMYVFKPDGIFMIYSDPSKVVSTTKPRILKVWTPGALYDPFIGKFVVEHQSALYFNAQNLVMRFSVSQQGNEILPLPAPFPFGRGYSNRTYVNGLASGGDTLFASYNNIGVVMWANGSWHFVSPFYDHNKDDECKPSGLAYFPQRAGGNDLILFGDGNQQIRLYFANNRTNYASQLTLNEQNKAFWFMTSFWDADLAELKKTLKAITLRAAPNGFNYKIIGAFYKDTADGAATNRTILERTLLEGLYRDDWTVPNAPASAGEQYPLIAANMWNPATGAATATPAPCYYTSAEFNNAFMSVGKDVTPNHVENPVQAVNIVFILYGWLAEGYYLPGSEQADYSYIESMILEYLPTQGRVPVYSLMLDLHALTRDPAAPMNQAALEDTIEFLRSRCRAETPTRFKIRDRQTGAVKTIVGFIQNDSWTDRPNREAKDDVTIADIVQFTVLSIEPDTA